MGYPKGIPPSPPQGGGEQESCQMRYCTTTKNPAVSNSGVIVLLIPFLASFLLHNHIRSNYLLQHLVKLAEVFDLLTMIRILS